MKLHTEQEKGCYIAGLKRALDFFTAKCLVCPSGPREGCEKRRQTGRYICETALSAEAVELEIETALDLEL